MNIFDPHITGSLSVSGSAEVSGNLTVLGTINATISGTTTNAISASHAAKYLLTSSFEDFTSSYTTGAFTGSFIGDGGLLYNIPASGVTGLNLSQISNGSITASVSTEGFNVNSDMSVTGAILATGDISGSFVGDGSGLYGIPASGVTGLNLTQIADGVVTASVSNANGFRVNSNTEITGNLVVTGDITGSANFNTLSNKPTLVSGSSQVNITGTTDYTTFSSSISTSVASLSSSLTNTIGNLSASVSTSIGGLSSSVAAIDSTHNGRLDLLETSSGSLNSYTSSNTSNISAIHTATGSLNSYTSSNISNISAIHTATSSLNSFTSSIDTTIKNKLNSETVVSGSAQVNITGTTGYSTFSSSISTSVGELSSSVATTTNNLSSSIATTNSNQDNKITFLELKTGSYATTGSNTFVGNQVISGSVIIRENLTVLGSSSITYTTSSQLRVNDNVITVNTSNPAERFGGLQVYDSGSLLEATGSLLWDSEKNRWVYQQSSEASYGGGVLLSGPRSSGSLGDELTLTSGKIARSAGGDHLNDSIITEYSGTTIGISGSLEITGSIISSITPLVSGSSQISFNGITDKPTLVSGSSQIIYSGITNIPSGIVSGSSQVLSGTGIWSGSAQLPSGVVSGSSQVLSGTGIWSGSAQLPSGVVSGSVQIVAGLPAGTVSGSSQITLSSTTGFGTYLNQAVLTTSNPTFNSVIAADHRSTGTGYITYDTDNAGTNSLIIRKYGTTVATYNSSGNLVLAGTITATNFSGTSSGTNTGDQTNITGNAGTVTNGLYTTGDQTITGQKTFPSDVPNRPILSGGFISAATGDLDVDIWGISEDYYPSHATAANAWGLRWYGTGNEFRFVGGGTNRVIMDMDTGDITSTGIISGTTIYGTWNGVAIANNYLANSSFYVGTTSISLGRGSASQTLSGVSIDGTAASETLATVTARGASTSAAVTFNSTSLTMSSHYYTNMYGTNETYVHFYPSGGNGGNYSAVNWRFWTTASGTKVLRAAGDGSFTWDGSTVKTLSNTSYATTFTSVSSITVTHNLGTKDVMVMCYDSSDAMFWPSSIVTISTTQVTITFTTNRTGRVVVTR